MRQGKGFTVIELIIALVIVGIVLAGAIPSFNQMAERQRITTAGHDFLNSLMYTRAQASFRNSRVALTYRNGDWHSGWLVYLDRNRNGLQDSDEPVLNEHGPLDSKIKIFTGQTVKNYIGYMPDGSSVHATNSFFADSITLCSVSAAVPAFRIKVSIGGRARTEIINANAPPCKS